MNISESAREDSSARIEGIAFVSAYVDDYQSACRFYSETLGLEKDFDMGESSCFFKLGSDGGFYLEGGNNPAGVDRKSVRATFTLKVGSASALYRRLQEAGATLIQPAPEFMGEGSYWFQFHDPSGNILEALGGE